MSLIARKSASPSPSALSEQLRAAQDRHAAAVAAANDALLNAHDSVLETATSRRQTIAEQVQLLQAEHDALEPVALAASQPRQATSAGK